MEDLTDLILQEIARAIQSLGGNPDTIDMSDAWAVNQALRFLGADIYLRCTVGSWRDTMTDAQVLSDLQAWNAGKTLAPDKSFIRDDPDT